MSNKNFKKSLSFDDVLELLNKLSEYVVHVESGNDVIAGFVVELNDKTKNYLCNLGVDLRIIDDDYIDAEEGWVDILTVWCDIQDHYKHDIYYTGDNFIIKDKEKQELLGALNKIKKQCDYTPEEANCNRLNDTIDVVMSICEDILQKTEGDMEVNNAT